MTDSALDKRIAQFANMAQADPENEMAHFSLGKALMEAGRVDEAADSFVKCTELAPQMSKAYQLAAEAFQKTGKTEMAVQFATRGFTIAAERGDLMPKNALADLLTSLGRDVPEVARKSGESGGDVSLLGGGGGGSAPKKYAGPIPEGAFVCQRTGKPGTRMARPPFKGPVGGWIQANISKETFDTWIAQGTKVINELRLDLSREQDEEVYDQHMREYLGIDDELLEKLRGKG
ncbi:MAG TPA: Fe(2+)-trafficking protein [Phycisphaerales bacterium]|nr:Fe(2+)-trafficking protein [Phycisphaerales bacterium]